MKKGRKYLMWLFCLLGANLSLWCLLGDRRARKDKIKASDLSVLSLNGFVFVDIFWEKCYLLASVFCFVFFLAVTLQGWMRLIETLFSYLEMHGGKKVICNNETSNLILLSRVDHSGSILWSADAWTFLSGKLICISHFDLENKLVRYFIEIDTCH